MIMFRGFALVFLALLGVSSPLEAQVFSLSINGTVTGTQATVVCNSASGPSCLSTFPSGSSNEQFLSAFDFFLPPTNLAQGDTAFTFGNPRASGLWSGTISNMNGLLTGQNLSFIREDSSCQFGAIGCRVVIASAATFNVVGGIPEPGTWATMLLGFFLLGSVLRHKPPRPALGHVVSSPS